MLNRCLSQAPHSASAIALLLGLTSTPSIAAERLPSYNVDAGQTSVSGISSGGYMAGQFHIAFSSTLAGAGIIAGGPYDCARGDVLRALNECMETIWGTPDPQRLLEIAQKRAEQGKVDDLSNVQDQAVYIFSGTKDETVAQRVVDQASQFYKLAGVAEQRIEYVDTVDAGHAMVTEDYGNECEITASPYINDCDYDQAGAILRHIYGPLDPPSKRLGGRIVEFDQSAFINDPPAHSMNTVGYAYVPAACNSGLPCRIHIAFHGCRQGTDQIGNQFYTDAGYNRWADANAFVVLYPQAVVGPGNPRGCWDWWGYDDPHYATRDGRQMAAVRGMLHRLAEQRLNGGYTPPPAPTDLQAETVTESTVTLRWSPVGDVLGYDIYVGDTPDGGHAQVNQSLISTPHYTVSGLDPETTYWFVVDAVDATGNASARSDELESTTLQGFCANYETSNFTHWYAGRAQWCDIWFFCAVGSGENLGFAYATTELYERPQGTYTTTPCAP